jgi:hypothetical protein
MTRSRSSSFVWLALLSASCGASAPRAGEPAAPPNAADTAVRFDAWQAEEQANVHVTVDFVEEIDDQVRSAALGYDLTLAREPDSDGATSLFTLSTPVPVSDDDDPPTLASKSVPVMAVEAKRIAGEKQIAPPDSIKRAMARDRIAKLVTSWKLCLGADGLVAKLEPLESSGYVDYDDEVRAKMQRWEYTPFMIDGAPTPVCTSVTLVYTQRGPVRAPQRKEPSELSLALHAAPPWTVASDGQFARMTDAAAVIDDAVEVARAHGSSADELAAMRTDLSSPETAARREAEVASWWSTLVGTWARHALAPGARAEATLRVPYGGRAEVPVSLENLGPVADHPGTTRLRATASATLDSTDAASMLTPFLGAGALAYAGAQLRWTQIIDAEASTLRPRVRYMDVAIESSGRKVLIRVTETFSWFHRR